MQPSLRRARGAPLRTKRCTLEPSGSGRKVPKECLLFFVRLDPCEVKIRTLQDLTAAGLKLGVANPDESALGALTRRLLRELGIEQEIETNVSTKTPTADLLLNQVRVGGLDAAIVYRANTSQVTSELEVINIQHPLARAVQPYAAARDTVHRRTVERLMDDISRSRSQYEAAGFRYLLDVPSP